VAWSEKTDVLDRAMLECLAVLAAANGRTLVEELNVAVKSYVLQEFAEQGQDALVERAFCDRSARQRP
jgi:hypothetical protein